MTFDHLGERFEEAHGLIKRSWLENKDQTIDFTPGFLRSCFEYPGADPHLSPALFSDGRLDAFVCAFPRSVAAAGESLRLAVLTFFTVAPELKGKGIGKRIWAECLERARRAGYDGAIHYCVDGNRSNQVTVAAAQAAGFHCSRVHTVNYLMRAVPPSSAGTPAAPPDVIGSFRELAGGLPSRVPFCRTWSEPEIEWQCRKRYGAMTVTSGSGVLTGYFMRMASSDAARVLLVEDLLWGGLNPAGQDELVQRLVEAAAGRADVIAVPIWGYASTDAFLRARFRRSSRIMHVYLTAWSGTAFGPYDSMYIDVF